MDAIGGYFQLELRNGEHYHKNAIKLNTARNCFEYVLLAKGYKKVYIPYYTCEVMFQPLVRNKIEYEFYSIDINFEPTEIKMLKSNEAFFYTNYYGLKQECVKRLSDIYGHQLIVDNAQAFYATRIEGIDTLYSARKFFGVSDGAYLYTDCFLEKEFEQDKSYQRMQYLLQRIDEGAESGYKAFRESDDGLDNQQIRRMSNITESVLMNVDYNAIVQIRRDNFKFLHFNLAKTNKLNIDLTDNAVPMIYPYMNDDKSLRQRLIANKIFIAMYWPNVVDYCSNDQQEYIMASTILPLPIDQRYSRKELDKILTIINN